MDSHGLAINNATPHISSIQLGQQFRCGVATSFTTHTNDRDYIPRLNSFGIHSKFTVECDIYVRTGVIVNLDEYHRRSRIAVVGNSIQISLEAILPSSSSSSLGSRRG